MLKGVIAVSVCVVKVVKYHCFVTMSRPTSVVAYSPGGGTRILYYLIGDFVLE